MSKDNEQANNESEETTTEVTDEALLDVISDAVDEVSDEPETDDDNGDDDEQSSTDDDAGTTEGESEQDGEADSDSADDGDSGNEDDGAADSGDSADSDEEDGDGDAGSEDEGDAGGDDDSGSDDDSADEADPINDPIPESTNEKTKERIQSLIGIAKEQTAAADQGREILAAIESTGADPQQYAATLAFIKLYNSDKPDDRRQALEAARGVVHELTLELGEDASDIISYKTHDDLAAEVEAGNLTEKHAQEIAVTRAREKLQQSRNDAATENDNRTKETSRLVAAGKEQLNNLETTLNASDPDYKTLRPTFISMLKPVLRKTHPEDWGTVAQELYVQLKASNPQVTPKPKPKPKNQPLRPRGDAGNSNNKKSEPSSGLEALDEALDSM